MKYAIFSLTLMCVFGLFFSISHAQLESLDSTTISVELYPQNPGPNEQVNAYLSSYSTDINSANITWIVDGKEEKSGIGEKSFYFKTGSFNTTTTLEIKVVTVEGNSIDKIYSINPTAVDLFWQSDGFTPPFYKGKTLFAHQNAITFVAVPHIFGSSGNEIPAKNLLYVWKKNNTVSEENSGYGKNTFKVDGALISRAFDVSVEVTDMNNTSNKAVARTSLKPETPFVIFYRKNPSYGIEFQKALTGNIKLTESKEVSVISEPFFFSDIKNLYFKWFINGSTINNAPNSTVQVFRQQEGASGISNISVTVENPPKILQFAETDFNLEFGQNVVTSNEFNF